MKRYEPFGMYEMVESEEGATYGGYVDADIAQELYNALENLEHAARMVQSGQWHKDSIQIERDKAKEALEKADKD